MMLVQVTVGVAAAMSMTVSMAVRVSSLMMSIDCRMVSMTHSLDVSLEAVVLIGRVFNHSLGSVGFIQSVSSLDDISVPMFPLALVISGVRILYSILELVAGMRMIVLMFVSSNGNGQQSEGGDRELHHFGKGSLIALILALAVAVFAYGHEHHDYHSHPSYKFEYGVKDPHTGDHKSQWEHRDGDVVKGAYTLDEADGTKRVVEYSSDKHNGFQAHCLTYPNHV
uniref:Uncharacterized protein n=1 Tax=Anopheles melas TaxID=34690 RepID=A0A182UDG7_9DIPT